MKQVVFLILVSVIVFNSCSSNPSNTEDVEVEVENYRIEVSSNPNNIGEVQLNPTNTSYKVGNQVTATALSKDGWAFQNWSGDYESNENPLQITVTNDIELSAYFKSLSISTYGGNEAELVEGLTEAADGGYVLTGYTSSTTAFEGVNNQSTGVFLVKYSEGLEVEWAKIFGGTENDVSRDIITAKDGGYLIVGESFSIDGDFSEATQGAGNMFLLKASSDGEIEWLKRYGGSEYDQPKEVIQDVDGNFLFTGISSSVDGDFSGLYTESSVNENAFVIKTDNTGNIIWVNTFGGSRYDGANAIASNNNSEYFVTGFFSSNDGDFDGLFTGSQTEDEVFALKLDTSGKLVWVSVLNGTYNEHGVSISSLGDGSVAVLGMTGSSDRDFSGKNIENLATFVVSFDADGNLKWLKTFNGPKRDEAVHLAEDGSGGLLVMGSTTSKAGVFSSAEGLESEIFLLNLSKSGDLVWSKTYGGDGFEYPVCVRFTASNNIIIAGTTESSNGLFEGVRSESNEKIPTSFLLKLSDTGQLLNDK